MFNFAFDKVRRNRKVYKRIGSFSIYSQI